MSERPPYDSCPQCGYRLAGRPSLVAPTEICPGVIFDPRQGVVSDAVRTVRLPPLESGALRTLLAAPDRFLAHEAIYGGSYSQSTDMKHMATITIHHLRRKLAPFGITFENRWGFGYRVQLPGEADG